jgi:hypothetical protein
MRLLHPPAQYKHKCASSINSKSTFFEFSQIDAHFEFSQVVILLQSAYLKFSEVDAVAMEPALALVAADVEGAVVVGQLADAVQGIILGK